MKEKIINILISNLSYCYCDNYEYGNWDKYQDNHGLDCHKKYQNWQLSSYAAAEIAEQIIKEAFLCQQEKI